MQADGNLQDRNLRTMAVAPAFLILSAYMQAGTKVSQYNIFNSFNLLFHSTHDKRQDEGGQGWFSSRDTYIIVSSV